MTDIKGFFADYRFLSNFYESPLTVDGIRYETLEHYYQAMKAFDLDDHNWVKTAPTPGLAKHRGRRINVREDWDSVRVVKMRLGLRAKFEQNPELKQKLLDTGSDHLEETNQWGDAYWGVSSGKGKNVLGELLMELRDSFRMDEFYD